MEVEEHQLKKRKQPGEDSMHVSSSSRDYCRSRKGYDRYSLTDGWLYCPPYGDNIGLIIPSKVPLSESFNENIPPGESYTPKEVIDKQRCLGREIGLVVDLTNTDHYYPESDWTSHGIRHVKIRCLGQESVPDAESVNRFISEVVQFTSQKSQASKYVVINCTHGHNRTGFMIVHFLVRNQSISVSEAIAMFAQARPPGIYRLKYIEALYDFYFQSKPEHFVCPQTPKWKRDSNQDNEVVAPSARRNTQIPGSHPGSLNRDKLHLLSQQLYHVTLSAEVQRRMMIIDREGCYFIDPQFYFKKVHL